LTINNTIIDLDLSQTGLISSNIHAFLEGSGEDDIRLARLNMSMNGLIAEAGYPISKLLEKAKHLEHFNIMKNNLEDGIIPILISIKHKYMSNKGHLQNLVLSTINMTQKSLYILSDLVRLISCKLKSLILNDNKLSNSGGISFFRSMIQNRCIKELLMYNCNITNEYSTYVYNMLLANQSLIIVSLYNNNIDNPLCFKKLLSLMKGKDNTDSQRNNRLKSFDLSRNKTKIDCNIILQDVPKYDAEVIDISGNEMIVNDNFRNEANQIEKYTKLLF
jgi:hypothetical protein